MTHRALAQEGPDLRREDISISPPRRRRHRHKGLARSRSNAVEDSRLGRLSHWPVLPRPQLAGFQVSTEGYIVRRPATRRCRTKQTCPSCSSRQQLALTRQYRCRHLVDVKTIPGVEETAQTVVVHPAYLAFCRDWVVVPRA